MDTRLMPSGSSGSKGNLDPRVDESLLAQLFAQCGPLRNVHIPRDKVTSAHSNYGFVEFETESDSDYALKILNMIKLYGKPLRCNKASQDKRTLEVGANLFIGNLDPEVDDKLLYDTLVSFGSILTAKVMRDPETGESKGFGFVSFDTFEASDGCLAAMNGQFLCNRPIHVSYAYKKDTKGERHGSAAERLMAANRPVEQRQGATAPSFSGMLPPMSAPAMSMLPQDGTPLAFPPPPPPLLLNKIESFGPLAPMPPPPPSLQIPPMFAQNRMPPPQVQSPFPAPPPFPNPLWAGVQLPRP